MVTISSNRNTLIGEGKKEGRKVHMIGHENSAVKGTTIIFDARYHNLSREEVIEILRRSM